MIESNKRKASSSYKKLLHHIAFNENQFEKREKLKDLHELQKQNSLKKTHSNQSIIKSIESQTFIEKLKKKIEKEKNKPKPQRPTLSSISAFHSNVNSEETPLKTQKKKLQLSNFLLKTEYLPIKSTFITENISEYVQSKNNFSISLKEETKYYSKLTFENLEKLKAAYHNFNEIEKITKNEQNSNYSKIKPLEQDLKKSLFLYESFNKDNSILEIKANKKFLLDFNQLEFYYFKVRIEHKESPLSLYLKNIDNVRKLKTKAFFSCSYSWPNRFNCELQSEGNYFKYQEPDKNSIFRKEFLYFSIFTAENVQIALKVKFGFQAKHIILKNSESKMRDPSKDIKELSRYILNEQIKRIHEKRKKKIALSGIENKVINNKKMEKFIPEKIELSRNEKINRSKKIVQRITARKNDLEKKSFDHKLFLISKPQLIRDQKELIHEKLNEHYKRVFKIKSWFKLINLLLLIQIGKSFLDKIYKKKMHDSYFSQIRRKALLKLVAFTRMVGSNANERIFIDSKLTIRYNLNNNLKDNYLKAKKIACKAIIQMGYLYEMVSKSQLFIKHTLIIQRKWKILQRKKIFFKFLIKELWKRNFEGFYKEIKGVFSKKQNRKSHLIENLDNELQNKIINTFMIENLKRWLNEMDEYRKQMRDIRKDSKVLIYIKNIYIPNKKLKKTTQFNVLKHFLIDENMKQAEKPEKSFCSFNFEENNDLIKISPPLLYKKPSDYQLKKMIKNYIEQKSLT